MGLRVRVVLVILLLLAVMALAVPLAMSLSDRRTAALAAERDRHLAALTDAAAMPGIPLQPLVDRYYEVYSEGLLIVDADGRTLASRGLDISAPGARTALAHALVAAPVSPWSRILPWDGHRPLATSAIRRDGELTGAAVLAVDTSTAARDIAKGWLWIGAGCLAFLLLAAMVARTLTRWVLRPLDGLERSVAEMTEGIAGPPADVAGPPELRHFTSAFNTMAQVVRASLDRQRRLVADASHQMRNPLAAVRLRADNLEGYIAPGGRSAYESMTSELDRFENLLQQLLRLARAEQVSGSRKVGLSTVAAESTDLGDVIAERLAFWEPLATSNEQRLCNGAACAAPSVQVPRHEVEQLIDVALDNAVRYAGPDATITVSATRADDTYAELAISDSGAGLPEDDLARAVSRFWRGREDGTGTGLGLAIAAEIAEGHGGAIEVHRAPEGGLVIRYRLPATDASAT